MEIPDPLAERFADEDAVLELKKKLPDAADLERQAAQHQAVADPLRLRILHLLADEALCPCMLTELVDIASSKLSYHLKVLKEAGLVEFTQEKKWLIYRLTSAGRHLLKL